MLISQAVTASLYCLHAENGTIKWIANSQAGTPQGPTIADVNNDGILDVIIEANDPVGKILCFHGNNGTQMWEYFFGSNSWSNILIADGDKDGNLEVYMGSTAAQKFLCLWANNGTEKWVHSPGGWCDGAPVIGDVDNDGKNELIFGMSNGQLRCLYPNNGTLKWSFNTAGAITNNPVLVDTNKDNILEIIFGSEDMKVYCIYGNNQSVKWTYNSGFLLAESSLAVGDLNNDNVFEVVFTGGVSVICLNVATGDFVWKYNTGDSVRYANLILDDVDGDSKLEILVGSDDDKLHCIATEGQSWAIPGPWPMWGGSAFSLWNTLDTDNDKLTNQLELQIGTKLNTSDSDRDFINDYEEILAGSNPLVPPRITLNEYGHDSSGIQWNKIQYFNVSCSVGQSYDQYQFSLSIEKAALPQGIARLFKWDGQEYNLIPYFIEVPNATHYRVWWQYTEHNWGNIPQK